jgi:hypothetical protein
MSKPTLLTSGSVLQAKVRPLVKRAGLLAVTLLVSLLLSEAAVRVVGLDAPPRETGIVPHPLWHHWHRPNYAFTYHVAAEGTSQLVHFNEHGMRESRAITVCKPQGVYRIAVLGDSFVEALQVPEEHGTCRRLEAYLGDQVRGTVEVLNFGCSGFSSSLELILLRRWVLNFEPDLVICVHHFSDMTEDWRLRSHGQWEAGELQAIPATSRGRGRQVRQVLELSQLFRLGVHTVDRCRRHRAPDLTASLQDSFDAIVHDPYTPADEEAWSYSLAAITQMHASLTRAGIPFLLVLVPIGPQVEPVPREFAEQVGFQYLGGGRRLEHRGYQRRMLEFCAAQEIDGLDLLEAFQRGPACDGSPLYLPFDQHWTGAGHDLAARTIAARVTRSGILNRKPGK